MDFITLVAPLILASMLPTVNALLVERSRDLSTLTSTANSASSTSSPSAGNQAKVTYIYVIIIVVVSVFLLSVTICILRFCCGLAFGGCCPVRSSNNKQVQYGTHIIVPVYEQPQGHNVPHPYAGGGYQGPYYNPQAEQYKAESYPMAYTPMPPNSPQPHSSRPSLEREQAGNYNPSQHPYNPNQQFQGR